PSFHHSGHRRSESQRIWLPPAWLELMGWDRGPVPRGRGHPCRAAVDLVSPANPPGDGARWRGVRAETMQIINQEALEYRFKQQYHLLTAVEQGVCYDAETSIEGLPISTVRNCSHRLMFVPAGRMFLGAQRPRLLTRAICLYIDPHAVPVDPDFRFAEAELQ